MGSNPPIKAIPPSVAEPNKHIAAYLHSVRPFTVEFATRGIEYFTRSRAGGDVLSEEDWKRDYYDVPAPASGPASSSSRQRRPQIIIGGGSTSSGGHHSHAQQQLSAGPVSATSLKRQELSPLGKQPGLPLAKRYSSTRPTPYARRSVDLYAAAGASYTNSPVDKPGRRPGETRERDSIDSDPFGLHLHYALNRAAAATSKRMPALPDSPSAEPAVAAAASAQAADAAARKQSRRSVPGKTGGLKLDPVQVAIQRPGRLSMPRSGILSRGVMSQSVKVSPYSHYEVDPMQDMAANPQAFVDATDLHNHNHPGLRHMPSYGPTSPYIAEYAAAAAHNPTARPVQWSPWAAGASYDSPVSQQPSHRFGIPTTTHWIDEIGSLYGLTGDDRRYSSYTGVADAQGGVRPSSLEHPSSLAVDVDQRRYRPVSAPLPDAMHDLAAEGAVAGLDYRHETSPSMEPEPLSPVAGGAIGGGMWGPRSDSHDNWGIPRPPPHGHNNNEYSWPSNDPVTPVSPSEEVITFGWGPPPISSPLEQQHPYNWPASATAGGATAAATKRESLPALNMLSLQSPSPFSPFYLSPADYNREVHAQMF